MDSRASLVVCPWFGISPKRTSFCKVPRHKAAPWSHPHSPRRGWCLWVTLSKAAFVCRNQIRLKCSRNFWERCALSQRLHFATGHHQKYLYLSSQARVMTGLGHWWSAVKTHSVASWNSWKYKTGKAQKYKKGREGEDRERNYSTTHIFHNHTAMLKPSSSSPLLQITAIWLNFFYFFCHWVISCSNRQMHDVKSNCWWRFTWWIWHGHIWLVTPIWIKCLDPMYHACATQKPNLKVSNTAFNPTLLLVGIVWLVVWLVVSSRSQGYRGEEVNGMELNTDRAWHLEVQDDGPNKTQRELWVPICNVIIPDVHQLDLRGDTEKGDTNTK